MSKTKRHKIKGKHNQINRKIRPFERELINLLCDQGLDTMAVIKAVHQLSREKIWDSLTEEEKRAVFRGYSKNPSWWNNLFNRRPKRAADRNMLKKVTLEDDQDLIFSDDNKPNLYYW